MTMLRVTGLAALAAIMIFAAPDVGRALDLGDAVRSGTRSVSEALSGGGGTSASVGSGPSGGLKAGAKSSLLGGTSVDVELGGSGAASVSARSGGAATEAGAGILSRGQLISLGLDPNATSAASSGGTGGISEAFARSLLADLNRLEAQAFRLKCRDVLRSPKAFDAELILLCKIVASL
jgi:hypothetical protein